LPGHNRPSGPGAGPGGSCRHVPSEVVLDLPDGEVHLGEPPGGVVRFLAEDADIGFGLAAVAIARGMGLDELDGLNEHPARAAAGVVDPTLVGGEHLHQDADDAAGRVELAALLALGAGELGKEVFERAPQDVSGAIFLVPEQQVSRSGR